ncbi:MAG: proline--tRNA ligase [Candidatus Babeliaceae bacterium]|nr:proline--tRNA ligase [Candidatus Babeliaceae bacterium]
MSAEKKINTHERSQHEQKKHAALPDINSSFSEWYHEVVFQAELADQAPVRGCIVIRPYGYALWEEIKKILDKKIKDTGHQNAQFPLLIPESFFKKEAEHIEGFAPELAIVTHAGGKKLEEPLVVRPTSETIIHYMFAQWIRSWRDLPLKINQWANVVRWEMRSRPFLRTTEFWWQEGHTAHETEKEALLEVQTMLLEYIDLVENYLAIPVVAGKKSESEKFAGADITMTFEGLMQDGKALQMGTSHMISQQFAHAFGIKYQDRNGGEAYPYLTSWGATTRLIGALIMTHGDQKGLIMPPRVAPIQIIIIPIFNKNMPSDQIEKAALAIQGTLGNEFRVTIDADTHTTPGSKFYKWELKGVPLRIEIGPRDIIQQSVVITNRLTGEKQTVTWQDLLEVIEKELQSIQTMLFERARARRARQWHKVAKLIDFADDLKNKGGFYQTGWCRSPICEAALKEYQATTRCLIEEKQFLHCFNCDLESPSDVMVAKSY